MKEIFMDLALELAKAAAEDGEVPVGCVVTDENGRIVGTGRNRREKSHNAAAHAEIEAIAEACSSIGNWRLSNCSLYVTLEPCPMCAGAIINSRIKRVFYGQRDDRTGSCGSVINLFMENYGHEPEIIGGVKSEECAAVMSDFFRKVRSKKE